MHTATTAFWYVWKVIIKLNNKLISRLKLNIRKNNCATKLSVNDAAHPINVQYQNEEDWEKLRVGKLCTLKHENQSTKKNK